MRQWGLGLVVSIVGAGSGGSKCGIWASCEYEVLGVEFHQVFRVLYQLENGSIGLYVRVLEVGRDVENISIALNMSRCKLLN